MRKAALLTLAIAVGSALSAADTITRQDLTLLPDEIFRTLGNSNRVLAREMREFRGSPAYVLLDGDGKIALDRAITFFERYGELGRNPERLTDFFNGMAVLAKRSPDAATPKDNESWWYSPQCKLERGDIVLARSADVWSDYFANVSSSDKRFSHIAVVLTGGESPMLVETDNDENGETHFSKREWAEVCGCAVDCAVFRLKGNEAVRSRIGDEAEKCIGIPFDPTFDLNTKDRLYCAEMVRDCVNEAAGREVIGTSRKGDFEYVAVDDCYRNEMTKVWDCRDEKPIADSGAKQAEEQPAQEPSPRPVVVDAASTTNAPVRRTIRFIPKSRGRR